MRIEQLEFILAIARTGSFTQAASESYVSQPHISQSVLALERELGVQIFVRGRAGATPTDAGQKLLQRAMEVSRSLAALKDVAALESQMLAGKLAIGAVPALCSGLIPRTLGILHSQFPGIALVLEDGSTQSIRTAVESGALDVGAVGVDEIFDESRLKVTELFASRIMVCAAPRSPLAEKDAVSLADVIRHPVITTSDFVRQRLSYYGEPQYFFSSRNLDAAKHAIAAGLAVGFYPEFALRFDPFVASGLIVPVPLVDGEMVLEFACLQSRRHRSVAGDQFVRELRRQMTLMRRVNQV